MKESEMENPNHLGHYHRDIVSVADIPGDIYYKEVTLSCGHKARLSRQYVKKYAGHATLCTQCTNAA